MRLRSSGSIVLALLLIRRNKLRNTLLAVMVVLFGLLLYIVFSERENTFSVYGSTHTLLIKTIKHPVNAWIVDGPVEVVSYEGLDETVQTVKGQEVAINIDPQTSIIFAYNNQNRLTAFLTNNDTGTVGFIVTEAEEFRLGAMVEIKVPDNSNLVLPFVGSLIAGEDVSPGVNNLLQSGGIRIVEKELFSDVRYIAGDYDLETGDRVLLFDNYREKEQAVVRGFLEIKEGSIGFSASGNAEIARVERFGSQGYSIKPSIWRRIVNDPVLVSITSILAIILLLIEITRHLLDLLNNKEVKREG